QIAAFEGEGVTRGRGGERRSVIHVIARAGRRRIAALRTAVDEHIPRLPSLVEIAALSGGKRNLVSSAHDKATQGLGNSSGPLDECDLRAHRPVRISDRKGGFVRTQSARAG